MDYGPWGHKRWSQFNDHVWFNTVCIVLCLASLAQIMSVRFIILSFFFFLQLYDISSMNYTTIYLSIIQLMDYCFQVLTCYEQSQHDCSCRVILVGIYTTFSNFTLGGLVL